MPTQRARVQTYRDFYAEVAEQLPAMLPRDLRDFQTQRMGGVFKVFYDDRRQHFELWFRTGGLEVAFHLEGGTDDDAVAAVLEKKLSEGVYVLIVTNSLPIGFHLRKQSNASSRTLKSGETRVIVIATNSSAKRLEAEGSRLSFSSNPEVWYG